MVACSAVIEPEETTSDDAIHNEDLLELGCVSSVETVEDLHYVEKLNEDQKNELNGIIGGCKAIITDKPGACNLVKHAVKLTSEEPVRSRPCTVPYALRQELKGEIKKMLE